MFLFFVLKSSWLPKFCRCVCSHDLQEARSRAQNPIRSIAFLFLGHHHLFNTLGIAQHFSVLDLWAICSAVLRGWEKKTNLVVSNITMLTYYYRNANSREDFTKDKLLALDCPVPLLLSRKHSFPRTMNAWNFRTMLCIQWSIYLLLTWLTLHLMAMFYFITLLSVFVQMGIFLSIELNSCLPSCTSNIIVC